MKINTSLAWVLGLILLMSCAKTKEPEAGSTVNPDTQLMSSEAVLQTCFVCHNPSSKSHDDLIAPPLVMVKKRYLMQYSEKEEFVRAIVDWVKNPDESKALMKGAVANYKLMPAQPHDGKTLSEVASFIYDNELEKPDWFDAHYQQMHGKGGMGMGQGKGNKQGKMSN